MLTITHWILDYFAFTHEPPCLWFSIRLNFLNHLEEWTEQASERAASVVVAKCEELNSELDLRLHLHKPRARRAEYDVHNVRAGMSQALLVFNYLFI